MSQEKIFQLIRSDISQNDVVLYMKGTPDFPQCGFSGVIVQVLNKFGVQFKGINVLENEEIRQGIKDFTNWPTIPQLYIKGEFIGGCDIVKEMYLSGEFKNLLQNKSIPFNNN